MSSSSSPAWIVTGPTAGYGRITAQHLAPHGPLVLVARNPAKLAELKATVEAGGGQAVAVVCDFNDLDSVRRATDEIVGLGLPLAGLVNNVGMREPVPTTNRHGWDTCFTTNHLGPFLLTETLLPALPDGASVLFVCSAVEDPQRPAAKRAGFRGSRFVSVAASARGEWKPGGSTVPGFDAYATSKQCGLAAALALSSEHPRLRINAIEPGFSLSTGLGGRATGALQAALVSVMTPILPLLITGATTPARAGRIIAEAALNPEGLTGTYFDEGGRPMNGSEQVRDPAFQAQVVHQTRALLQDWVSRRAG